MLVQKSITEKKYPLSFRPTAALDLERNLKYRHNVELVGMRRVGISNFLRFFLFNLHAQEKYLPEREKYLLITIDLNDLIELEILPFWMLTFKRIVDAVRSSSVSPEVKKRVDSLFVSAIQLRDILSLIDDIRWTLSHLVAEGYLPTLLFVRFDRMQKESLPNTFFENLTSLRESADGKLSFVFTAYRNLTTLFPTLKNALEIIPHTQYLSPGTTEDMQIYYDAAKESYDMNISQKIEQALFRYAGGHLHLLQQALVIINEHNGQISDEKKLFALLSSDERIMLQCEELWESLTKEEKAVVETIIQGKVSTEEEREQAKYLWNAGFVVGEKPQLFTPLFEHFVTQKQPEKKQQNDLYFTKKENTLFITLQSKLGEICERDDIVDAVWPESQEFGVSDWAIDRLVARVRVKLRAQGNPYEIQTIRTRGYKLTLIKE